MIEHDISISYSADEKRPSHVDDDHRAIAKAQKARRRDNRKIAVEEDGYFVINCRSRKSYLEELSELRKRYTLPPIDPEHLAGSYIPLGDQPEIHDNEPADPNGDNDDPDSYARLGDKITRGVNYNQAVENSLAFASALSGQDQGQGRKRPLDSDGDDNDGNGAGPSTKKVKKNIRRKRTKKNKAQ